MALNVKQEKFIQNIVKGMSQRQAYKDAYQVNYSEKSIDEKACTLFNSEKVQERYKELMKATEDKAIMTAIERKKWLTDVINNNQQEDIYFKGDDGVETKIGSKNADLNTKMKAMDILNKMDGEYIEKLKLSNDEDKPFEISIKVIK